MATLPSTQTVGDFVHAIAGLWYNPDSKNKYLFTPSISDPAKGQVSIIQHGSDNEISLSIALEMRNEAVQVLVEGAVYGVVFFPAPEKCLTITLAPGKIVRLLKHC